MEGSWVEEMRSRMDAADLPSERSLLDRLEAANSLPFSATRYWMGLATEPASGCARDGRGVPLDPILAQALPSPAELERVPADAEDPLGERGHSPSPRLIHQYPSRVLLRVTGECPVFCRHCFRRSLLPGERGFMTGAEIESAHDYLAGHPEVREALVSGGDPLTAPDAVLERLFARLRDARPGILIRLCTRAPVTLPSRVTPRFADILRRHRPVRVVIHANHPRELTGECAAALEMMVGRGVPVRSQTVLLRGINDDPDTLEALFAGLAKLGVDPYYLFQCDLAAGTAHFRVPLSRGLGIYAGLRHRLSGLEMPRYAVDAPGGGGKVYLPEDILGREGDWWLLKAPDGTVRRYPEESAD